MTQMWKYRPSTKPLIAADWVRPGTHITAIGADCLGKQELETGLVLKADLAVCDLIGQSLDHGEFQHAQSSGKLSKLVELGQILSETHPGRPAKNAITISSPVKATTNNHGAIPNTPNETINPAKTFIKVCPASIFANNLTLRLIGRER